jgi:hypothetical protein
MFVRHENIPKRCAALEFDHPVAAECYILAGDDAMVPKAQVSKFMAASGNRFVRTRSAR